MNVTNIISSMKPDDLEDSIPSEDHSSHIVYLALKGYTKLAADHLLHREMKGYLEATVGNTVRQLSIAFNKALTNTEEKNSVIVCARVYDSLLNIVLNLYGMEKIIVEFSDVEVDNTLQLLKVTLSDLEQLERKSFIGIKYGGAVIANAVVNNLLDEMKKVMKQYFRSPGSMVACTAAEIEKTMNKNEIIPSFLQLAQKQIQNNVYYKMSLAGMCKFGNDYALGLRWLRHIGFVQVSTNPSLAAIAYDDDPTQWEGYKGENLCPDFKTIATLNIQLLEDPDSEGDMITAYATEVSIWRNLAVFRPIAVTSNMFHGMVSLQLNPNIANHYADSVKYALKIYTEAEEFLRLYDTYLLWGYSEVVERGRPNIVFKVAGSSSASIEITKKLESLGIGTNNTVTFTVSQEVELILSKIEGRVEAVKKGIPLTTVYETNMGGRLDDHIREVQVERIIKRTLEKHNNKERALKTLAKNLGAWDEIDPKTVFHEKVITVSNRKFLRPMNKKPMIDFLLKNDKHYQSRQNIKHQLNALENDIQYCGILVTKRVYEIFFSKENRDRWITHLQTKHGISEKQAAMVLNRIDILPASKRHPRETLLTLAGENMTHTEFPNHQMNVLLTSWKPDFCLEDYNGSVTEEVDSKITERLYKEWTDIKDEFVVSYEVTPNQLDILRKVGISRAEVYGNRGLKISQWRTFGATRKTMKEFSRSYETFKQKCIKFVRDI